MTQAITFPSTWTPPKYYFGQLVKQGEIVGMEYYDKGGIRGFRHGDGWLYWIVRNPSSEDAEIFEERRIIPLTEEELHARILDEVRIHGTKVAAIKEQLDRRSNVQISS